MRIKKRHDFKQFHTYYSFAGLLVLIVALVILIWVFGIDVGEVGEGGVLLQPTSAVNLSECGQTLIADTYYILNISLYSPGGSCLHVNVDNIVIDGQFLYNISGDATSDTIGILVDANNFSLINTNISYYDNAIVFRGANFSLIEDNYFVNYSRNYINISFGHGHKIKGNEFINNSGVAIIVFNGTGNLIEGNYFLGNGLAGSIAINLDNDANNNIVRDNDIDLNFNGIVLFSNVLNLISGNNIDRASVSFYSYDSLSAVPEDANVLEGGFIRDASNVAIRFSQVNLIVNGTSISKSNNLHLELESFSTEAKLVAMNIDFANYNFDSAGTLDAIFVDEGNSEIRFLEPVLGSGNNLSGDVKLGENFVEVNSSNIGLNRSANVTFFGLSTSWINPEIRMDGVACPSSICRALTSLTAGTVVFNVSHWTSYSVFGEQPPVLTINEPDINEEYRTNEFPKTFSVVLDREGEVSFNIRKRIFNSSNFIIVLNKTMNSDDNLSFSYVVDSLEVNNYTMIAFGSFNGLSVRAEKSVNFTVVPGSGWVVPGNNNSNNNSNSNSSNNITPSVNPPGGATTTLNGTNATSGGGGSSNVEIKDVAYWLIIAVLIIAVIIVVFLIVRHLKGRALDEALGVSSLYGQNQQRNDQFYGQGHRLR
jgi:hypothetical protein